MKVERICNFYASKYHLGLILLEYLKEKRTKKTEIITFLQDELEDEIYVLKEKYNYNEEIIDNINFKTTKNIYEKELKPAKNIIYIVEGNLQYINEANEYILENTNKGEKIRIINCHNFAHQRAYMREILEKSDKILYTTGEKVID